MKTYDEMIEFARYAYQHERIEANEDEAYPSNVWAMFEDETNYDIWDVAAEIMEED